MTLQTASLALAVILLSQRLLNSSPPCLHTLLHFSLALSITLNCWRQEFKLIHLYCTFLIFSTFLLCSITNLSYKNSLQIRKWKWAICILLKKKSCFFSWWKKIIFFSSSLLNRGLQIFLRQYTEWTHISSILFFFLNDHRNAFLISEQHFL